MDDVNDTFEKLEIGSQNVANATITDEANPDEDVVRAQISVDKATVAEGGVLTYTVNLIDSNGDPVLVPVGDSVTVVLDWTGVAANPGDASPLPISVTITGGSSTSFVVDAIDDVYKEDPEALIATITSVDDVNDTFEKLEIGSQNQANATITDEANPDEDVVRAQISVDKATVAEGGVLTYTVNLIDSNGDPVLVPVGDSVTVVLDWTGVAANPGDASPLPISVTITGGSSTSFVVDAIDDVYKEDPEALIATITSVDDVNDTFEKLEIGSQNVANATITDEGSPDEDVVFTVIESTGAVNEGGLSEFVVSLVDKDGNPVTVIQAVNVDVSFAHLTSEPGDFDATPVTVTINTGSSANFFVQTISDLDILDETFTASIASVDDNGQFEKVDWTTGVLIGTSNERSPSAVATIIDINQPVQLTNITLNVSEEGLTNGLADTVGINDDPDGTVDPTDTTDASTDSASMNFSDPENESISATLEAPTQALTSAGVAIVWSGMGTDTLTGTAGVGGGDVITIHVDNTGMVSVDLLDKVDHPLNPIEDVVSVTLNVNVSDGVNNTVGTVTINIEDDRPVSADIVEDIEIVLQNTNLMFIIDTSGSMGWDAATGSSNITTIERMELLLTSIRQVIDGYDDLGSIRVQMVTFAHSDAGATHQNVWMSAQQALDFIGDGTDGSRDSSLNPNGGTNYDAALNEAKQGFESTGKITNGLNVSYFLSDGQPTTSGGTENSDGITGVEIGEWTDYLELHDINSFAIGFGSGLDVNDQGELDPIAYDGINEIDTDGMIVVNAAQLAAQLLDTIDSTLDGDILSGSGAEFGADGGRLLSVTVDAVIYTFDPAANGGAGEITTNTGLTIAGTSFDITTALNGHLILSLATGQYSYNADSNLAEGQVIQEVFDYSLIDNDGDYTSGAVTLNINRAEAPDLGLVDNLAEVDEEALPEGTNSASSAEIVTGNLVTDDANVLTSQLLTVTIGGGTTDTSVAGQITVTTAQGNSLVVDSDINSANYGQYTYTLINAVNHHYVEQPGTAIAVEETYDSAAQVASWGSEPSLNSNRMRIEKQDSATKVFDFGEGHANQMVTITFDLDVNNSEWEANEDYVRVTVNGAQQVAVSADGTHTFTVSLDNDGRADITIYDDASASDEYIYIDNFKISGPNAQILDPNNTDPFIDEFTYTVLDNNGFTGSASLAVTIINDVPVSFTPETAIVLNKATSTSSLLQFDIEFAESAGADGVGNIVFTSSNGTQLFDKNNDAITFAGENIYLYVISENVIEGRTSTDGGTTPNDLAFTATLDPSGDTYTIDLEGKLGNSVESSFASNSGISGGNNSYYGLGINTADPQDILVTAGSNTVNSSTGNIGVGSGNDLGSGDTARFDMVLNLVEGASIGDPLTHGDHYQVGTFTQEISRVQGGGNNKTKFIVTIRSGDNDNDYLGDTSGEAHNGGITVTLYDRDPSDPDAVVKKVFIDTDNSVEVKDVKEGYYIEVSSTQSFSIVEYEYKGNEPFNLGDIRVSETDIFTPIEFNLAVTGIDGDSDSVDGNLAVNLKTNLGLAGGSIDVDTYIYSNGSVSSNVHEHAYDTREGYTGEVDAFDFISKDSFAEIDNNNIVTDYFVLMVLNGHRNAATNIKIDTAGNAGLTIDAYQYGDNNDGTGFSSQVYTLNAGLAVGNVNQLVGLQFSFDDNAIINSVSGDLSYGLRLTETGDVNKDEHGTLSPAEEHRDGAFSIIAVKVTKDGGNFILPVPTYGGISASPDIDPSINPYIVGLANDNLMLWETTIFAHTSGTDPRSPAQYINNTDVNGVPINNGIFVDGIVEGLSYSTSSGLSGLTDVNGGFKYATGDLITFSIGSVIIGSVTSAAVADGTLFLQEIAGVALADMNDDYVEKMAVLLQSLDNDGDAYNGIVIEQSVRDAFADDNFDLATISKADLQSLLIDNGYQPIDEDAAMQHVRDMIELETGMTEFDQRDNLSDLIATDEDDIFAVELDENGEIGEDIAIIGFGEEGNDALDLSDLLSMGEMGDDLSAYLYFSYDGENTTIEVSTKGAFTDQQADASQIDQTICLQGVDLMGGNSDVDAVIQNLLDNGSLIIDE